MALTTRTIEDSVEWVKRMSFERNPVLGNSLQPALTAANIVMQTILGPPFEWWWNLEEINFNCNPTPKSANATAVSITSGVLTVTATNTFSVGNQLLGSSFAGLTALNGLIIEVASATGSQFTAQVTLPNGTDTTGVCPPITTQDYTLATPEFPHTHHASALDLSATGQPTKWMEMEVRNHLS